MNDSTDIWDIVRLPDWIDEQRKNVIHYPVQPLQNPLGKTMKVSGLKDKFPDNVAELLIWIAGGDFQIEYTQDDITKKTKMFKKPFVKNLFTQAFEFRVKPMIDKVIVEELNDNDGVIGCYLNEIRDHVADLDKEFRDIESYDYDGGMEGLGSDMDRMAQSVAFLEKIVRDLTESVREARMPGKNLEERLTARVDKAIEKMEDRYYAITGRRKLLV